MINELNAMGYCRDDITLIENYDRAVSDETQMYICHHKREITDNKSSEELIRERMYYQVPADELIFLTEAEHKAEHRNLFVEYKGKRVWLKIACKCENIYYTSVLHRMRRKEETAQEAFDNILRRKNKTEVK